MAPASINARIFRIIGMPIDAVGYVTFPYSIEAQIILDCAGVQMVRIYAAFCAADMVKNQSFRDWASHQKKRNAVSNLGFEPTHTIDAVSLSIQRAEPNPTA
jgi:hypothetical protein